MQVIQMNTKYKKTEKKCYQELTKWKDVGTQHVETKQESDQIQKSKKQGYKKCLLTRII